MPPGPADISAPSNVVTVVMVRSAASGVTIAAAIRRIPASRGMVNSLPGPDGTIPKQSSLYSSEHWIARDRANAWFAVPSSVQQLMLSRLLKGVAVIVVVGLAAAALLYVTGMRIVLYGGGNTTPRFVSCADRHAAELARHRESQRAAAPVAAPVT